VKSLKNALVVILNLIRKKVIMYVSDLKKVRVHSKSNIFMMLTAI